MCDNWYVVQVRAGQEERIKEACLRLVPIDILQEVFIPKYKRMRKTNGSWRQIEAILFPGYVFMISDDINQLYQQLKQIIDLTKILGNDGQGILSMRKEEVMMLLRFGKAGHVVEMSYGFIEGQVINITDGPLMGCEGIVRKIDRHKRIANIEVEMFGQSTVVKVGLEIITKNI